jgi:hypothetical protein
MHGELFKDDCGVNQAVTSLLSFRRHFNMNRFWLCEVKWSEVRACNWHRWNQLDSMFLKLILTPRREGRRFRQSVTWSVRMDKCLEFLDFSFYRHLVAPTSALHLAARLWLNMATGRVWGGRNYTTGWKTPQLYIVLVARQSSNDVLFWPTD